jgi:hypothetical protein
LNQFNDNKDSKKNSGCILASFVVYLEEYKEDNIAKKVLLDICYKEVCGQD